MNYVETHEGKLIDAKGITGRYVRLHSRGNTDNEFNHYIEVEVYGKAVKLKPVMKNRAIVSVIVILAILIRFISLADRPMHNDEAVNAFKLADLLENGTFIYDKNEYHGPNIVLFKHNSCLAKISKQSGIT
jgi:hypothetical protein